MGLGRSLRCATVEKACLERDDLDVPELFAILRSHDGTAQGDDDSACRHGEEQTTAGLVLVEPAERKLWLVAEPPCRVDPAALHGFEV